VKRFYIYTVCFLTLALLVFSCNDGDGNPHRIPICTVSIDIDQRSHDNDFAPGRIKTFDHRRGPSGCYGSWNGGVVVVNIDNEDFRAFDMACPNDHWLGGVVIEWQLLSREIPPYFQCAMCNTRFNPLDGTPMEGAATRYVMRQYSVTRAANGIIQVRN